MITMKFKRLMTVLLIAFTVSATVSAQYRRQPPQAPSEYGVSNLIGVIGGIALTSNPPALQTYTGKASYTDGNGGLTYLYHNQVNGWYAFEWQLSMVFSSVSFLESADDEDRCKFIFPVDFRWFLGNPVISAYCGAGLQYNTVWVFTDNGATERWDPWLGYYDDPNMPDWDWTINQLSANLAFGLKIGFGNTDTAFKKHALILGTKFHFPMVNASDSRSSGDKSIDLSRDRTNVSLTGALSFDVGKGWTFKFDYELPCGGNNTYEINDGGHSTFLNSRSQSLSLTILKRI